MNDTTERLTKRVEFDHIPAIKDCLLEVRTGIPAEWAASKIACLAESIKYIATDAVQGEMDAPTAYLVAFAADAIQALSHSIEFA